MSKSWGHKIKKLTDADIAYQVRRGQEWAKLMKYQTHLMNSLKDDKPVEFYIEQERKCRISKHCKNQSLYMLTYNYITGRTGRVGSAGKPICSHHAEKYMDTLQK